MTLCLWAHFLEVTSSNPSFHFIHIYFQPVFPFQLVCFQFRGGKCFMGKVQGTIVCCKPARVNFCTWDYTSPWFLTFASCGWWETSNPPGYQVVTNGKETHVTVYLFLGTRESCLRLSMCPAPHPRGDCFQRAVRGPGESCCGIRCVRTGEQLRPAAVGLPHTVHTGFNHL